MSHKSLVLGCSKNASGQGVRTEPARKRSVTDGDILLQPRP
ncbi:MAG: hypothetical protein WCR07_17310 [Verrucomicrobiota bacterium]